MKTRYFALFYGIAFLLTGIAGFIPGLLGTVHSHAPELRVHQGYGYLLGLFPVNVLHNAVHLIIGVFGLVAYTSYTAARNYGRGVFIFYGLLTILGFIPVANTLFGLVPIFGHDIWLHALAALIAGFFGFLLRESPDTYPTTSERVAVG
jgi:hypothetical protein